MPVVPVNTKNVSILDSPLIEQEGIKISSKEKIENNISNLSAPKPDTTKQFWVPSFSIEGLNQVAALSPIISSSNALIAKSIANCYIENKILSREDLEEAVLQYLYNGNIYLLKNKNNNGEILNLSLIKSEFVRISLDNKVITKHFDPKEDQTAYLKWEDGIFVHLKQPSPLSGVYGLPYTIGVLHQVYLGNDAVIFRRNFYMNGAHMGYLIEIDANGMTKQEEKDIRESFKASKGAGNFTTNIILSRGREKTDKQKVHAIPLGDISAQDEFPGLKGVVKDDIIMAMGVPVSLLGGLPSQGGMLGDSRKAMEVFGNNKVDPLCNEIKSKLKKEGIKVEFKNYAETINLIEGVK